MVGAHDGVVNPRHALAGLGTALLALAFLAPATAANSAVEGEVSRALQQLAALRTTAAAPAVSYERNYFGTSWADVDQNGCRTRDDILARDLTATTFRGSCTVMSGVLADPYAGKRERFSKARASAIQIDHVIPLSLAWRSGASTWPAGKLAAFANDPLNLLAVDGPANQAKSDSGPSAWLPPNPKYRCTYVMRFVRVSFLYGVSIAAADRGAAKRVLHACTTVVGHPTAMAALSPALWPHAAAFVHARP